MRIATSPVCKWPFSGFFFNLSFQHLCPCQRTPSPKSQTSHLSGCIPELGDVGWLATGFSRSHRQYQHDSHLRNALHREIQLGASGTHLYCSNSLRPMGCSWRGWYV
ncbi:hypothetical protein JD844_019702, partial [Phrynosoma platyrhinos]